MQWKIKKKMLISDFYIHMLNINNWFSKKIDYLKDYSYLMGFKNYTRIISCCFDIYNKLQD